MGPHATALKIGLSIFGSYAASFAAPFYAVTTGSTLPGLIYYLLFINNLANFFIYLAVDVKFRDALKNLCQTQQ